jgi:hypothetical protein
MFNPDIITSSMLAICIKLRSQLSNTALFIATEIRKEAKYASDNISAVYFML